LANTSAKTSDFAGGVYLLWYQNVPVLARRSFLLASLKRQNQKQKR
jgi:hypothetical protein